MAKMVGSASSESKSSSIGAAPAASASSSIGSSGSSGSSASLLAWLPVATSLLAALVVLFYTFSDGFEKIFAYHPLFMSIGVRLSGCINCMRYKYQHAKAKFEAQRQKEPIVCVCVWFGFVGSVNGRAFGFRM